MQILPSAIRESVPAKVIDGAVGVLLGFATLGLFVFDITEPRGVVDGVGYAAVVALSSRFGSKVIIGCAIVTTVLTVLAAFLLPDAGISYFGMWANRTFALIEVWIVAAIFLHRLSLEDSIALRSSVLRRHQDALSRIVRIGFDPAKTLEERVRQITEICVKGLDVDGCAVLKGAEDKSMMTIIDRWNRLTGEHTCIPDIPINTSPGYREAISTRQYVTADDVLTSPMHESRLELFGRLGVRAILAAAPLGSDSPYGSIAFSRSTVHHWTEDECAFACAAANLVALLLTSTQAEETLASLDLIGEGILVEDASGKIKYRNKAACDLTAGASENGGSVLSALGADLAPRSEAQPVRFEGRDLEIQRTRLPSGDIISRVNDVTGRNAAQAARNRLEEQLQQAAKMEAIGQLAGGVAHDFNNILAAIQGFAGFLEHDLPPSSQDRGFASRILRCCERGRHLVAQILAFARTRSVEREIMDLIQLLVREREIMPVPDDGSIQLSIHTVGDRLPILANEIQITQLVVNLFANACDVLEGRCGTIAISAAPADSKEIEMLRTRPLSSNERMSGEFQPGRRYCRLSVSDNGPGIPAGIMDRIFEPFFTTKGKHRGTGLGLSVVHGVTKSHDGVCHVRSSAQEGTVFAIYLPFAEPASGTGAEAARLSNGGLRGTERILVVDDEPDVADALTIALERKGYSAVSVNDPREALAAITEDPEAFDVVITDQVMADVRGMDLIGRLKAINPAIKTILCTGFSDSATQEQALLAGADGFFHKPVDVERLLARIRSLMDAN